MIENIIINKTATPDLTGEFAGGLVLISTRDIPTRNALNVSVQLGYNTQSTFKDFTSNPRGNTDWLGFDNGTREIPKGVPNTVNYRALSRDQNYATSALFKGDVYREEQTTALPILTTNITWSNTANLKNGGRFGTIVSVFYRRGQVIYDEVTRGRYELDRTPVFEGIELSQNRYSVNEGALANFSWVKGKHKVSFKNLFNQLFEDNYYIRQLSNLNRNQNISLRSSFLNQRTLYSGQLEGESVLTKSGIKLNWNGNYSYNFKEQPDLRTAQYVQQFGSSEPPILDDDDTRRFFSKLKDHAVGALGSLSIPFTFQGQKQLLKVGGSTVLRFRDFRARLFNYRPGSLNTDDEIPYDRAFLPSNIGPNGLYLEETTQNSDTYWGTSVINGGYVMLDNRLGDFRIIWGGRIEYWNQILTSRTVDLKREVVDNEKYDFLPSLNITYSINSKNQVRLSGSRTLARPEFREIAPFSFFDYEQIWGVSGNPELRRTSIWNGDARYEFYPKSGELISFGILVKQFTDPIELRMNPASNADRFLYQYSNADEALLYGAEAEFRKGLEFISPSLKDVVFIANATYLDSRVTLTTIGAGGGKEDRDRPLYGQSPYLINAGFQYNTPSVNATILYNRIGPRLFLVGDPTGAGFFDVYERPRNLLDLQVSKKVFDNKGEVRLTVADLLNNKFAFYDNPSDSDVSYKASEGDRFVYTYRPGTTISIGFTYDFALGKKK